MCSPPQTSLRMKCYWGMLSPLGVSLKGHLGSFIPDMKVEGNIIEALQRERGFSFQQEAWKGRVVFLHPLREKPHNWLKRRLFSSWLPLEVIGIYEVFMVLRCECQPHREEYVFLDRGEVSLLVVSHFTCLYVQPSHGWHNSNFLCWGTNSWLTVVILKKQFWQTMTCW